MLGRLHLRSALLLVAALSLALAPACQQVQEELDEQLGTAAPDLPGDGAPDGGDGGAPADGADGADGSAPAPQDAGPLGANATLYLRGDLPRAVIEVDAVEGSEPSGEALSHLRSTFGSVADKPDGVEVRRSDTFAASGERYSTADLRALEDRHRQTSSGGGTASLYVLVVNGESANNENALGVAYSASAFAIFRDKIEEAAGLIGSASTIERAVMVHELGHVLRLVNIGYESPRNREDPEHPHHSTHEDSVMFWAVESDLISQVLDGPPPDTFDSADRADLEDIKAGRLG